MKSIIKKTINSLGYDIVSTQHNKGTNTKEHLKDFSEADWNLIKFIRPYTRTTPERIIALKKAIEYIVANQIPGDIVECGVWRGGNILAVAQLLSEAGKTEKNLYLYDTYEGMSEPSANDVVAHSGESAEAMLQQENKDDDYSVWCYASLEDVKATMGKATYPREKFKYIQGKVEDTIPAHVPEQIALLRLDTDWYESTKHELIHLFPRLVKGGVIIIDDYGHWEGARLATDEYIKENGIQILLNRIDYTGRIGIKL